MAERDGTDDARVDGHALGWDELAAFLAVARHGGLSAAARATDASAPTLGRRMRALERRLGRELFVRRTQGYALTDEGRRLRDGLEDVATRIDRLTRPSPADALPLVRVTAGTRTMLALAASVERLVGEPPDLRLRLLADEDVLSIPRREAAIGFRNRRPVEGGLAGRRLRRVTFAPYAVADAPARWIRVVADTPSARWVAERGEAVACETATPRLALDLALRGVGRALLPTFVGDAQPPLERVGAIVDALSHEQWLVTHQDDRHLPEVRRALDRLAAVFDGRDD